MQTAILDVNIERADLPIELSGRGEIYKARLEKAPHTPGSLASMALFGLQELASRPQGLGGGEEGGRGSGTGAAAAR